jgi:hypothetical protein
MSAFTQKIKKVKNYIGGEWVDSISDKSENRR